jgi:hypothetical protein
MRQTCRVPRPADHEGHGLRFEFPRVTRGRSVVRAVQQFMREFVNEGCELHSGRETFEEPNAPTARRAKGAVKVVDRFECDALPKNRGPERSRLAAGIT